MKIAVLLFLLLPYNSFVQLSSNFRTLYTVEENVTDSSLFISHYLVYNDSVLEEESYKYTFSYHKEIGLIKLPNG